MSSSSDSVFRLSGRRFFLMVLWLCVFGTCASQDIDSMKWLRRFGYLPQASTEQSAMISADTLSDAISDMQRLYNLEVTGQMDHQTITAMKQPRCGVSDKTESKLSNSRRQKRYALGGYKWDRNHLTYSIQNYSTKVGEDETYEAIRKAIKVWEEVTPLTFEEIPYEEIKSGRRNEADIMMLFPARPIHGQDGQDRIFDGPGGVLAHAFYPDDNLGSIAGDLHFESWESWTIANQHLEGTHNLFLVAVHELGHSLGLEHSNKKESIMFPKYQWMDTDNFQLPKDDVLGIQDIYEVSCYTGNGTNYRGAVAKTISGKTCQGWSAQTPHNHDRTPENNPSKGLDNNYCRNPNNERMPWCYTTDSQTLWEFCQVPKCDVSRKPELTCYTCEGKNYRGEVNRTNSGRICQNWSDQWILNPENYPRKGLDNNYCRNPGLNPDSQDDKPWCYTSKKFDLEESWEACPVPTCDVSDNIVSELACYTGDGVDYRGKVARTISGKTCQRWSAQTPHSHDRTPENHSNKGLDNNYCRNPDCEKMPWCYTIDSEKRWEYCQVPLCDVAPGPDNIVSEQGCYTGDGVDYRGKVTRTISGKTCQSWSAQTPHSHDRTPENHSNKGLDNNHYCRNPDNEKMPWCYTTDSEKRWEYCPVPLCDVAPGPELISH